MKEKLTVAIAVPTLDEYITVIGKLLELGCIWKRENKNVNIHYWSAYREETVICVEGEALTYGISSYPNSNHIPIITSGEFLSKYIHDKDKVRRIICKRN